MRDWVASGVAPGMKLVTCSQADRSAFTLSPYFFLLSLNVASSPTHDFWMCEDIQRGSQADRRYSNSGTEVPNERTRDGRSDSQKISLLLLLLRRSRPRVTSDAIFLDVVASEGALPPVCSGDGELAGVGAGLVADISDLRNPQGSNLN